MPQAYTEKDFDGLLFNPLTKKPMLKAYPRLSEICPAEFDTLSYGDLMLRYVCLLYDPKSPLITSERDLNYRKQVAAELAGFDTDKDDAFLQTVYQSEEDWLVDMVMLFLIKLVKQRQWALICALEAKYWEGIKRVMQPIAKGDKGDKEVLQSVDIKAKISDELFKDLTRLETLWSEFFGEDSGLINAAKLSRITPESIALGL
jgi:hypothetical protein